MKQPEQDAPAQIGRPLTAFEDCNRNMLIGQANAFVAALHGLNKETPPEGTRNFERSQYFAAQHDIT